jgi:predicted PurR-regulated permease PerM
MSSDSVSRTLFYVVFGGFILYFGRALFIPLSYGLFIALLLYPMCRRMEMLRISRSVAILLSLVLLLTLLSLIVYLLIRQVIALQDLWPGLQIKLEKTFADLVNYLERDLKISKVQGKQWLTQGLENSIGAVFGVMGSALSQSVTSLVNLLLIPIYTFLILYYRTQFARALTLLMPERMRPQMQGIMREAVQSYVEFIKGMLTVYLIVGVLNSLGLLLLGIPNALLFGFIASILTFIPYVGIMIASLLPIAVSWSLYDSIWQPLGVVGIYTLVQYLEANLIFPWAVSQRVNLNTLATLVIIVAGGILWGASGMILFIPFAAILRLVADKVEGGEVLILLLGGSESMKPKVKESHEQTAVS